MLDTKVVNEAGDNLIDKNFSKKICSERGAGMVEYALLVALMSIGCMGAISMMAAETQDKFNEVANAIATGEVSN